MLVKYKNLYKEAVDMANELKVYLVSNIREKTINSTDYDGTSIMSEYLSFNQQELIIESLRIAGFEVAYFTDETEFIENHIKSLHSKQDTKKKIIINMAQKGTAIGRKSLIPAFCDLYDLWHTNSNPYVVSLARNKYHCSCLLKANKLPTTTDYLYLPNEGWLFDNVPKEGEKVIVKLNYETSSIGLTSDNIFTYNSSKEAFIHNLAQKYNQTVVVQHFVEGFEVEVPIIIADEMEVVLPVGITVNEEKDLGKRILDYNVRRELKFGFYDFVKTNSKLAIQIEECTKKVAKLFGITGFGRVDFRIDYNNKFYITDIATNPHITKGMSFYYAFKQNELNYTQMLETLIAVSIRKYYSNNKV